MKGIGPRTINPPDLPQTALFYRFAKWFFYILFRVGWRLEINGQDNIPRSGAAIISPNHRSYADPPLAGLSCPREVYFFAKKQLFSFKPFGFIIRSLNAVPVNRRNSRQGIKDLEGYLRQGYCAVLFPEGKRIKTNELGPPKGGVGLLASKLNIPIVPVYIHNSNNMKRFKKLSITFGKPISPKKFKTYEECARAVIGAIQKIQSQYD